MYTFDKNVAKYVRMIKFLIMRWVHESSKWRRIFESSWESRGLLFRSLFENKSLGQL
jgi:hypothetical protein